MSCAKCEVHRATIRRLEGQMARMRTRMWADSKVVEKGMREAAKVLRESAATAQKQISDRWHDRIPGLLYGADLLETLSTEGRE